MLLVKVTFISMSKLNVCFLNCNNCAFIINAETNRPHHRSLLPLLSRCPDKDVSGEAGWTAGGWMSALE